MPCTTSVKKVMPSVTITATLWTQAVLDVMMFDFSKREWHPWMEGREHRWWSCLNRPLESDWIWARTSALAVGELQTSHHCREVAVTALETAGEDAAAAAAVDATGEVVIADLDAARRTLPLPPPSMPQEKTLPLRPPSMPHERSSPPPSMAQGQGRCCRCHPRWRRMERRCCCPRRRCRMGGRHHGGKQSRSGEVRAGLPWPQGHCRLRRRSGSQENEE